MENAFPVEHDFLLLSRMLKLRIDTVSKSFLKKRFLHPDLRSRYGYDLNPAGQACGIVRNPKAHASENV
jgi:hypothetical protein